MKQTEIHNAKIVSTMLGYEDHGILSFNLTMEYGCCGQGFGGWALDGRPESTGESGRPTKLCGVVVAGVLHALDLRKWEDVKGQYCRIRIEDGRIEEIGHIVKDRWFCPRDEFQRRKSE